MIYIFTALYCEANALIKEMGLVRDNLIHNFQVFHDDNNSVVLTVTGSGKIAAACAVSSICTHFDANGNDFFINYGCCAGIGDVTDNGLFLCNKITDYDSKRTFYPDLLYRNNLSEAEIATVGSVISDAHGYETGMYDMEASGIYQALGYFAGPHQMSFVKFVSDKGDGENVTQSDIERLSKRYLDGLLQYIGNLQSAALEEKEDYDTETGDSWIDRVSKDMHCSATMKASFMQLIKYCRLSGTDYKKPAQEMYAAGLLPCANKNEGKKCLERFAEQLL